jgi:serine-type D-Ala-D-Ala carboxypeptidase (penicillin-binding protein 5/6)
MANFILIFFLSFFMPVFLFLLPYFGTGIEKEAGLDRLIEIATWGQKKDEKGNLAQNFSKKEEEKKEDLQSCNLFPVESSSSGFVPTRKKGYTDLNIWATSSVVLDVDSGTILHYDDGRKRTQIASLTKIMTAILVMEKIENLDEEVTIPLEALMVPGTVVGCPRTGYCLSNRMFQGEKVKARDLLKAMLMNSANDAATALGIHIAGSSEEFVTLMNDKAKKLGLKDTNFCTPSGLEVDGRESECYSTAYDIARIASVSLKKDEIWNIMRISEDKFYSSDGRFMHELKNTDLLLQEMPNCLGGKTGFTPLAGKSLLSGFTDENGNHKIIAVILNDEKRWEDMRILANWVFNNYEWK